MKITHLTTYVLSLTFAAFALPADQNSIVAKSDPPAATQPAVLTAEQKDELEKLVVQLDSDDFKIREAATQKIKDMGQAVLPILREMSVSTKLSPEVKSRINLIIDLLCPLSVRIVAGRTQTDGSRQITLYGDQQHFYVVVTNTTTKSINLWREWCSWGYYNLSFEILDASGKKITVTKGPMEWIKNYPDFTILGPGDHMVLEVNFSEKIWQNSPLPPQGKNVKVKMKAIYSIPKDDKTQKNFIWTGTISSPEETYTIYR